MASGSAEGKPRYREEKWLRRQYHRQNKSTLDIADECGCTKKTVLRWIKKHDIETRSRVPDVDPRLNDSEWLQEQYSDKGKSTRQIAEECGCVHTVVLDRMEKYSIETRSHVPDVDPRLKDGDWLQEQYIGKEKTTYEIAEECGCSSKCVLNWLNKHSIDTRTPGPQRSPRERRYGPGWNREKRQSVRERDGHRCVSCSITQTEHKDEYGQKLHVHHLIKARNIDDPEERNAPENLITLCRDCHYEWERLSEAGIRPQVDGVTTAD